MTTNYLEVLQKAGHTPHSIGKYRAAELLGLKPDTALKILKQLRAGNPFQAPKMAVGMAKQPNETQEQTANSWDFGLNNTRIHTLEQLIEHFQIDTSIWECSSFRANKWEVGAKDEAGNIQVEPLFQVKANFVRAKGMTVDAVRQEIERLKKEACSSIKKFNIGKKRKYESSGNALEISIADLHSGKLSWGEETLGPNYDHEIAAKLYEKAFTEILKRTTVPLDRICLVIGNDLLNADSRAGTTTRGTVVNNDSRYHKNFLSVFDLIMRQINTCLDVAPVDAIFVPGNHDESSVWHLGHSVECFYSGNQNVLVNNSPAYRKYWNYGVNMLMLTHGNDAKHADLPLLMATEMPHMFSASTHREIHLGHLHQLKVVEKFGVRTRIIPSLSPADWWHSTMGYINNIRAAQGFVWNENDGLIETKEFSVPRMGE